MKAVRISAGVSALAAGLTIAVTGALPASAAAPTYSGRAYAVGISGLSVVPVVSPEAKKPLLKAPDTFIADTGQLPTAGGKVSSGPGTFPIPGLGTVTVTKEEASGADKTAAASSEVASVVIPNPNDGEVPFLKATVLTADTTARACGAAPSVESSVASLKVFGRPVPVNPAPNSTVTLFQDGPNTAVIARITFNAQSYDAATNTQSASAVVVAFPGDGELRPLITGTITISHAESDLLGCPSQVLAATAPPTPPVVTVPTTGASSGEVTMWSVLLLPGGLLLVGLSSFALRRRSNAG